MKTATAIQSQANVVRITSVVAGDVYKRFNTSYSDSDRTIYGVVKAVHNDGENTIIESTEYEKSYGNVSVNTKIIQGKDDVTIFPATPEDLNLELESAKQKKIKEIQDNIDANKKMELEIKDIEGLISGKTQKTLQAMSYKELTQSEYNEKKLALN